VYRKDQLFSTSPIIKATKCTGTPESGSMTRVGTPHLSKGGETGAEAPFHNSIIGNFMVYQDRVEVNLLQLFAHPENTECFQ